MEMKALLTPREVAAHLKISLSLSYKLIADGVLPGIRFGRTVRVREEELILFVQQNSTVNNGAGNKMPWQ